MWKRLRRSLVAAAATVLAGCGGDPVQPPPVTFDVALDSAQYVPLAGGQIAGAVRFPAAGPLGASWLVVGQLVSGRSDMNASARLGTASAAGQAPWLSSRAPRAADRFHVTLRRREAELARAARLAPGPRALPPSPAPPPIVGDQRTFKVCSDLDCNSLRNVRATAQWVGTNAAIFLDDTVPAGGFALADLQQIGAQFDTVLYPIDVSRFGSESDIDGNGVVLILLTDQVNALVPKPDCNNAFVTGFFFGADIQPGFATQYNNGELFYGLVPDPGSATRCAYPLDMVKRVLPVTFIHEFQHMISFNQHVLARGGAPEVLWLNEALSHLAEELGSLHYDSLGDQVTRSRFQLGNLYNAYLYLREPHAHHLLTDQSTGTLEERGAGWLFVRYLLDRYGAATTNALTQTSLLDVANVEAAAGTPIETLLTRWALALYVSDLPGFTAPPELRYTSWRFRTTYGSLHNQDPGNFPVPYPLTPDSALGGDVVQSGALKSGSGAYVLPRQGGNGAGFELTFRVSFSGAVPAGRGNPQLTVLRLR